MGTGSRGIIRVKCEKQKPICQQCRHAEISCSYEPYPDPSKQQSKRQKTGPDQAQDTQANKDSENNILVSETTTGSQLSELSQKSPQAQGAEDANTGAPFLMDGTHLPYFEEGDNMASTNTNHLENFYLSSELTYDSMSLPMNYFSSQPESHHSHVGTGRDFRTPVDQPTRYDKGLGRHDQSIGSDSGEALDFDESTSRPLRYIPEERESRPVPLCRISIQGGIGRFVTNPFWAFARSRGPDCDLILQRHLLRYQSSHFDESRWSELSQIAQSLPPKKLCDALLRSFLLGVRPIVPLIHIPTFRVQYESFWARWQRDRSTFRAQECLGDNPSFLCLLWAVLYCGAVAASSATLSDALVRVKDMPAFLSRLRSKLNQTLDACCQTKLPTLNGLAASLLAQDCDPTVDQFIDMSPFISQSVQAAITLGLHREGALGTMGEVDAELGRRIWHHIVSLDIYTSIHSGTPLSSATSEEWYDTRFPKSVDDASIGISSLLDHQSQQPSKTSSAMLLATGVYEFHRILRRITVTCYQNFSPDTESLKRLVFKIEAFEVSIDVLISQLEVRGLPEQGQISHQLLQASPRLNSHLYLDDPRESTTFNSFARIKLCMMKYYVSIFFNRQFLHQTPQEQLSQLWNRLPAFSPYHWCCLGKMDPIQECLMMMSFLKDRPPTGRIQLLQYLLSEVMDIFKAQPKTDTGMHQGYPAHVISWQVLEQLYMEVQGGETQDRHQRPQEPVYNEEEDEEEYEDTNDAEMLFSPDYSTDSPGRIFNLDSLEPPFGQEQQQQRKRNDYQRPKLSRLQSAPIGVTSRNESSRRPSNPSRTPSTSAAHHHDNLLRQQQQLYVMGHGLNQLRTAQRQPQSFRLGDFETEKVPLGCHPY
ncbi:hypothetical protein HD806DRAFT_527198 [Xylariaceae sp. AK1471]|nr:hypothetical protein HD806DRAFT_527198 [Xylariaceae sp. AK1471]